MKLIEGWQKKKIYAIANALNYVDTQDKENDILHILLWQHAKKESVKELSYAEANEIISYLSAQQGRYTKDQMTQGQIKKVWSLMYDLKDADSEVNATPIGERLAGIIRRQFNVRSSPQRLFTMLTSEDGNTLIEVMKHYVATAERRLMS